MSADESEIQQDVRGIDEHPRPVQQQSGPTKRSICTPHEKEVAAKAFDREGSGDNGDEKDYPDYSGSFHKGLLHNGFGEVDQAAYEALRQALLNRDSDPAFENAIKLHRDDFPYGRQLINPQAGFSSDTEGPNPKDLTIPPAPKVDSAEEAAEAIELYWMAVLRDVPFSRFHNHPLVAEACEELSKLEAFRGPRDEKGRVTPATLFRGSACGDLVGPYVSQFLLKDIPYGSLTISQRQKTTLPGVDYLTRWEDWLEAQNGFEKELPEDEFDTTPRHMRSMRDLGQYVHVDALYEAYLNACLILLGIGAPVDDGNPYKNSRKQQGFGTFGGPHILSLVCEVATRALKAVWYQKWVVHRRLRPEAYGGLVHLTRTGKKKYPIDQSVVNSKAVEAIEKKYHTCLLPMAFPEGSPTHPAYGAGHATVAGACVTILKAWFDEAHILPDPVRPSADGLALDRYSGSALTVGGELNKVAANIAIGRNMAGVHWRTDYTESLRLGERVAIQILEEQSAKMHEDHAFSFTMFDGQPKTIEKRNT
jgi:hypothetical protein